MTSRTKKAVIGLLLLGFVTGCVWRFTPLHQHFGFDRMVGWGQELQGHPWTPYAMILVFILGGLLFFAHALLLWVTIFTFDLEHAAIYCIVGSMASAITLYWLGRVLRKDFVAKIAGSNAERISQTLGHKGILTLFLLHLFPVCPFSVLNLLAGTTHINFRDFLAGTFLGMMPGLAVLLIFGNQFMQMLKQPTWTNALGLVVFIVIGAWSLAKLRKRILPKAVQ